MDGYRANKSQAIRRCDARFLENLNLVQPSDGQVFEIDEQEYRKLVPHTVRRADRLVSVTFRK